MATVLASINKWVLWRGEGRGAFTWSWVRAHDRDLNLSEAQNQIRGEKSKKKVDGQVVMLCQLTDPAFVGNNVTAIIIHGALGNVVLEVGFGHLVARVQMHFEVIRAVHKVGTIHPLAVDIIIINVVTTRRYPLISPVGTVPYLLKTRVALGVL